VIDLGANSERLAEASRPEGGDHELLEVKVVPGVLPPVDDVKEGNREEYSVTPAHVLVEPHAFRGGCGLS